MTRLHAERLRHWVWFPVQANMSHRFTVQTDSGTHQAPRSGVRKDFFSGGEGGKEAVEWDWSLIVCNVQVMNPWSYTDTTTCGFMEWRLLNTGSASRFPIPLYVPLFLIVIFPLLLIFVLFLRFFYCCIKMTNKYYCPLKAESFCFSTKNCIFSSSIYLCVLAWFS